MRVSILRYDKQVGTHKTLFGTDVQTPSGHKRTQQNSKENRRFPNSITLSNYDVILFSLF